MSSSKEIRNKVKVDIDFQQRLLDYIDSVLEECLLDDEIISADDIIFRVDYRVFQLYVHSEYQSFDDLVYFDFCDIIRSRQMHKRNHMPTCFKYESKKCRSRFPHAIVDKISFDEQTGVILTK